VEEPLIIAPYLRELLEALPRLGPAAARASRTLPAGLLDGLRATEGYVPFAPLARLADEVLREWGPAGLRRWAIAGCLAGMQGPAFAPFLEAAVADGFDPARLMHHATAAARVHFRGVGEFRVVHTAEDGASVEQAGVPPALRAQPTLLLFAGMIEAFPVACGLEAGVRLGGDPAGGRVEYHVGWWVPGALQ
jgi:hypothetical protein